MGSAGRDTQVYVNGHSYRGIIKLNVTTSPVRLPLQPYLILFVYMYFLFTLRVRIDVTS
jgi:hypothetical protein